MTTTAPRDSRQPPIFSFTTSTTVAPFTITNQEYLHRHSNNAYDYVAVGALVFTIDNSSTSRILLLQRAATDSMPLRWEVPGGGCDDEDASILHSAARELYEESGLVARHISGPVSDPQLFTSKSGKRVCRFNFMIDVVEEPGREVKMDPNEHQAFVWADEREVVEGKKGNVQLLFTGEPMRETVLKGFQIYKDAVQR